MSLTSEVQSNNGSQMKLPRHSIVFREVFILYNFELNMTIIYCFSLSWYHTELFLSGCKDSKENIGSSFHGDAKVIMALHEEYI